MHTALIGLQWGDEGKGKLIDYMANSFDCICRYQGGANAGHTVIFNESKISLHLIPSGIFHRDKICIIGNGVVIDIKQLEKELKELIKINIEFENRFFISKRAHIIQPGHFIIEKEMAKEIGTTGKAIGPAYADKSMRKGIRMGDIFNVEYLKERGISMDFIETLVNFRENYGHFIIDTVELLHQLNRNKKRILFEGAQGVMLDIDFGTYPFVTSSSPSPGGVLSGTGISPFSISRIIGVTKAYTTRVGNGPFPTEMNQSMQDIIRERGSEYGATTGRPRRCGWLDLVALKYAIKITGATELALSKIDVLDGILDIKVAKEYQIDGELTDRFPAEVWKLENIKPVYNSLPGWNNTKGIRKQSELPKEAKEYIHYIEDFLGISVSMISNGGKRGDIISD
ncbi:adenylosuccinate synthase [candidate division WOR-3 bacterium]|nr:adenylosuccinate synthase [candidate division WOR-3 bacterium]